MKRGSIRLITILLPVIYFIATGTVAAGTLISPSGEPPVFEDDYFEQYHNNPCDFKTPGDFERIAGFGDGIADRKVENGSLAFNTGEAENYFFFGRWFFPKGDPTISDENMGFGFPPFVPMELKIRLKQSLPSSTWKVGYRVTRGAVGNNPGRTNWSAKDRKIEGTDWQEVSFGLGLASRPAHALYIETVEAGNAVEIDSIRVVVKRTPLYLRKELTLSAAPVHARMKINLPSEYEIFVNGKRAEYYRGFYFPERKHVLDITKFLRKGRNVIAVGSPNVWHKDDLINRFNCQGLALTRDGNFQSFDSDLSWMGTYREEPGWQKPDFDDAGWTIEEPAGGKSPTSYLMAAGQTTYVGPLYVPPDNEPIYNMEEGMVLSIPLPKEHRLSYSLSDAFTEEEVQSGDFAVSDAGDGLDVHTLKYKPDHPGVWHLAMDLHSAGTAERIAGRTIEVPVVGPIKQKRVKGDDVTEGMELRKLLTIDCTREYKAEQPRMSPPDLTDGTKEAGEKDIAADLVGDASGNGSPKCRQYDFGVYAKKPAVSKVVETSIGSYRESDDVPWTGFGYTFPVENLYRPHLIEVEYPDDQERLMMTKVFSSGKKAIQNPAGHRWNWNEEQRWHSGVATGGDAFPVSDTFKKLYLIFWPDGDKEANSIQIFTERPGMKAAARRITIYEIDDLPALDVPDTPDRLYGMFVEREMILAKNFYPGEFDDRFKKYGICYRDNFGRIRDWYVTMENLIKYLRFSGQNLYVPGYCMYSGIFFPENRGQSRGGSRRLTTDHFRLMAAMFEANNLNLLLGAQYEVSQPPMEGGVPTNWEVLHEGKESVLGVCADGRQALKSGSAGSGCMDFQNPRVDEDLRAMLRKFLQYSEDYKSVRGVLLYTASLGFPSLPVIYIGDISDSALSWGLTDRYTEEFAEESGRKLPGAGGDPARMLKRYYSLLDTPETREKWVHYECERLHKQLVSLLELVKEERPDWKFYVTPPGPAPVEWQQALRGEISLDEAHSRRGYDYRLYKENGIVNNMTQADRYLRSIGRNTQEIDRYAKDSFFYVNRWPVAAHTQSVVPTEPYAERDFVFGMTGMAPSMFIFGKADIQLIAGGEQRLRPFVKAYRSLPGGEYTTLRGNGLDRNIVIRRHEKHDTGAFYIVNHSRWSVESSVMLDRDADVIDLVTGRSVDHGKTFSVSLPAYTLRTYRLEPAAAELVSADARVSKEGLETIQQTVRLPRYNELLAKLDAVRAGQEERKENSLQNGDFEDGLSAWDPRRPSLTEVQKDDAWLGASLRLRPEHEPVCVSQSFHGLDADQPYTASLFLKVAEGAEVATWIHTTKYGVDVELGRVVVNGEENRNRWWKYTFPIIAPSDAGAELTLRVSANGGVVCVDGIRIARDTFLETYTLEHFADSLKEIESAYDSGDMVKAYDLATGTLFRQMVEWLENLSDAPEPVSVGGTAPGESFKSLKEDPEWSEFGRIETDSYVAGVDPDTGLLDVRDKTGFAVLTPLPIDRTWPAEAQYSLLTTRISGAIRKKDGTGKIVQIERLWKRVINGKENPRREEFFLRALLTYTFEPDRIDVSCEIENLEPLVNRNPLGTSWRAVLDGKDPRTTRIRYQLASDRTKGRVREQSAAELCEPARSLGAASFVEVHLPGGEMVRYDYGGNVDVRTYKEVPRLTFTRSLFERTTVDRSIPPGTKVECGISVQIMRPEAGDITTEAGNA